MNCFEIEEKSKLDKILEHLESLPQTPEHEISKARIEMRLQVLDSKHNVEVFERALDLFNLFLEHRSMRAAGRNGAIIEGAPTITSNSVQNVWNIKSEAIRTSRRSLQ